MRIYESASPEETERVGEALARHLSPGAVVALYGDLGAGKTAFVRGMGRGLGVKDAVTSPTFNIVHEYRGKVPLFHFDMYRLSGASELYDIGWDDYLSAGGVCVVEWTENVEEAMPPFALHVKIAKTGPDRRRITVEGGGL